MRSSLLSKGCSISIANPLSILPVSKLFKTFSLLSSRFTSLSLREKIAALAFNSRLSYAILSSAFV